MTYIQLSYGDLALPALLVVMDGVFSLVLRLKLEKQLAIVTVRMVLQLVLVGYVLTFLFAAVSPLWTALAALIMVLFASREIVARQKRRLPGIWSYGLGAGCTLLAAGTVTMFALLTELRPDPWYHPRYALPLLGMMLGNTMTGISLGLDALTNSLVCDKTAGSSHHRPALPDTRERPCWNRRPELRSDTGRRERTAAWRTIISATAGRSVSIRFTARETRLPSS